MKKIKYVNTERLEVLVYYESPFFLTGLDGLGAVENEMEIEKSLGTDGAFLT